MSDSSVHHKTASATASSLSYSVRRMRNTAVLVKWIEDHQSNPYPTKAEKQYLAYYSGMNLTQLSTWFANARRRIKKIGMKTWLEGRSTFSLDYFPSPIQRPSDSFTGGGSYTGLASTSPYAAAAYSPLATGLHSSYPPHQHSALGMAGSVTGHMTNGLSYDTGLQPSSTTTSPLGSLYGMSSQARSSMMGLGMPTLPMAQWPSTPILSSTPVSFPSLQSRPSSGNAAPLHSPLTAQVYTADATTATMQLRSHSAQSIDVGDTTYTLQQPSPDQMLPECASTEPVNSILTDHKGATALQN